MKRRAARAPRMLAARERRRRSCSFAFRLSTHTHANRETHTQTKQHNRVPCLENVDGETRVRDQTTPPGGGREERREALVAPWEVEEVKEGSLADPES